VFNIAGCVNIVSSEGARFARPNLAGDQPVIRKKFPVIDVLLGADMPANWWYIMWMAINTIPVYAT
jgi:hypothetical protein